MNDQFSIFDEEIWFHPSVVIAMGKFSPDEFGEFQKRVNSRLALRGSEWLIQWTRIGDVDEIHSELDTILEPFYDIEYINDLYADYKLISKDYLPDAGELLRVNLIIVCDLSSQDDEKYTSDLFEKLFVEINTKLSRRLSYQVILVGIGDGKLDVSKTIKPALKIRISSGEIEGIRISRIRQLEICQSFVIAAVSTNFISILESATKKSDVDWHYLGASAASADIMEMKLYTKLSVMYRLLEPLDLQALNPSEQDEIRELIESRVKAYIKERQNRVRDAVNQYWEIDLDNGQMAINEGKSPSIIKVILAAIKFREKGFTSKGQKDLPEDVIPQLSAYYNRIFQVAEKAVGDHDKEWFKDMQSLIATIMDPIMARNLDAKLELKEERNLPTGLLAADFALSVLDSALKRSDNLKYGKKEVPDYKITGNIWNFFAKITERHIRSIKRMVYRERRRLLSLHGTLILLVPGILLLVNLIQIFTSLTEVEAFALGTLVAVGVCAVEYINDWLRIKAVEKAKLTEFERQLGEGLILKILSNVLIDYKDLMRAHFKRMLLPIKNINKRISLVIRDYEKYLANIEMLKYDHDPETFSIFEMVNFRYCDEWSELAASEGKSRAGEHSNLVIKLVAEEAFPLFFNPDQAGNFMSRFEYTVDELVEQFFQYNVLETYVLAKNYDPLEGGMIWDWLFREALPGGKADIDNDVNSQLFYSIDRKDFLQGPDGCSSKYWPNKNLPILIKSRLGHEIMCIRTIL